MTKIILKNIEDEKKVREFVLQSINHYSFNEDKLHINIKRFKGLFEIKVTYKKEVVEHKDFDVFSLIDSALFTLNANLEEKQSKVQKVKVDITLPPSSTTIENEKENVEKIKHFIIKPTTESNALEHMELLGHDFYLYIDMNNKPILLFKEDNEIYEQVVFESLTVEDAIYRLFAEKKRFVAFKNKATGVLTIAYKRKGHSIGLIDAKFQ